MWDEEIINDKSLIAHCGLYCGACRKYLKGRCPGCLKNEKAGWCKIRRCCIEHDYHSCAECREYEDVNNCRYFNNLFSRVVSTILRSDRKSGIDYIKENGYEGFAGKMASEKRMAFRK